MKKWVSDVVTQDKIKSWNDGDIITIEAGTGAGKSHFIKDRLYKHAKAQGKKILFLIHRSNCVNQFQMEIETDKKTDVIDIKTYQHIEAKIRYGKAFDFSDYQYIVCDEFHYFMSDASFNKYTDMSLHVILEQIDKTRIFMSATGDMMEKYISGYKKFDTTPYKIQIDYNFISKLVFFNKDETFEHVIKQAIDENKKAILFIDSAEKAYNLYKKYKDYCLFNCSKHNDKFYKYVDEEKINKMLKDERFEENILITTTCLDTGVNIIDKDLYCIFCDVKDIRTLIQCVGRKRIQDKDDTVELYIKTVNNKSLGGLITKYSKRMEMARFLKDHSQHGYIEQYPRDYDRHSIVYTDIVKGKDDEITLKINQLIYMKYLSDVATFQFMVNEDFGYCKFIARLFGFFDPYDGYDYILFDEEYDKSKLEIYLETIMGKVMLTLSDRKELITAINVKQDGKLLKSLDSLNSALAEQNINYSIKQFETSRIVEGKKKKYKSAWKVMKLVEK